MALSNLKKAFCGCEVKWRLEKALNSMEVGEGAHRVLGVKACLKDFWAKDLPNILN